MVIEKQIVQMYSKKFDSFEKDVLPDLAQKNLLGAYPLKGDGLFIRSFAKVTISGVENER